MEGLQYGLQQGYNPLLTTGFANQGYGSLFGQFGQQPQTGIQNPAAFQNQNPFGGLMGSGIPGLLGTQGRQSGQVIDGLTNMISPYNAVDPTIQLQQAQLAQLIHQAQIAQIIQQAQVAQAIAQRAQLGPYSQANPWQAQGFNRVDPYTAYAQQAQIAQLCQQLGQQLALQGAFGHYGQQFGQTHLQHGQSGFGQSPWTNFQGGRGLGQMQGSPFQGGFQHTPWQSGSFGGLGGGLGGNLGYGGQTPLY